MKLTFQHLRVYVADLERAREFYETILELPLQHLGAKEATFSLSGGVKLVVTGGARTGDLRGQYATSPRTLVRFQTPNIHADVEKLKARGVHLASEVASEGKRKIITFQDADGNFFELVQE